MSHTSHLRRRLGVALLATGLAGGLVLVAAPAQALRSEVCIAWTSSGWGYIDSEGNDITVIEARCSMWLSTGGEIDEPKEEEEEPKGVSPGGDETKEEHCAFLKEQLEAQRTALAWAQGGIQAADDELDRLNFKSAVDHATYVDAHEEYLRAKEALDEAKRRYAEENDTEQEHVARNGNTVVVQLAVDPNRPWGDVVIEAQRQLDRVRAAERAAWNSWSSSADPAARAAQQRYDAMNQVLGTAPLAIEAMQRELAEDC